MATQTDECVKTAAGSLVRAMSADCIVIAALDSDRVIGDDGAIPWDIQDDLQRFRDLTMGNPVIVGRKTWESMPKLDGRETVVISKSLTLSDMPDGTHLVWSISEALELTKRLADTKYFVAGGASIYEQFLDQDLVDRMELTLVDGTHEGDKHFPEWDDSEWSREYLEQRNGYKYVTLQ